MTSLTNSTLFDLVIAIGAFVLGAIGLYVTLRVRARRSIKLYLEQATTLTESFQTAVPELAVTLGSDQIHGRVVMLKLALANQGNRDVAQQMVHSPVQIGLPTDWRWLKVTADNIRSTCPVSLITLSDTLIELKFSLFQASDVIFLQFVAEAPGAASLDDEDIIRALNVSCRIQDIGAIKKLIVRRPNPSWARSLSVALLAVMWLLTTVTTTTRYIRDGGSTLRFRFIEVADGIKTGVKAEALPGPGQSLGLFKVQEGFNADLLRLWSRGYEVVNFSSDRDLFSSATWHLSIEREAIPIIAIAALSVAYLFMILLIASPWIAHWRVQRILRRRSK
jgi:hypothetical protein